MQEVKDTAVAGATGISGTISQLSIGPGGAATAAAVATSNAAAAAAVALAVLFSAAEGQRRSARAWQW